MAVAMVSASVASGVTYAVDPVPASGPMLSSSLVGVSLVATADPAAAAGATRQRVFRGYPRIVCMMRFGAI